MIVDTELGSLLEQGYTLPASWYGDDAIWQLEKERIFGCTWQYAGPIEWVAEHGAYFSSRAGHIPVVVVRDGDELRAFVNVCRHRAHLVVEGRGRRNSLQCPYHAWTFGLDGCLKSAPRLKEEQAPFAFSELGLRPLRVEAWGPMVFVNADLDCGSLVDALGPIPARILESGVDLSRLRLRSSEDWAAPGNWKNAIENNLECYHCAVAHPGFSKVIDVAPETYQLETHGLTLSQYGPRKHEPGRDAPELPVGDVELSQYHMMFPNTSIDITPGPPNLQVYAWRPTGPHGIDSTSHYYFDEDVPEAEIDQIVAFNRQVGSEDMGLIRSVQAGLDSGTVPHGRLMPESEKLIARFQRLVYDALVA